MFRMTVLCGGLFWAMFAYSGASAQQGREGVVAIWDELYAFLSIPNFAPDRPAIMKNISWLEDAFKRRGFSVRTLETDGNPLFFAQFDVSEDADTVLFYMHFDGQDVDPAKWHQKDPYTPVLKARDADGTWKQISVRPDARFDPEWRIFCRSASDDKSPIVMFLAGMDALAHMGKKPGYNIKVILDSEEESGSPHLAPAVSRYSDVLAADRMMILDGPRHVTNKPTVMFGCRGIATMELRVFGPRVPQHSGHYGNYAPNPALLLSQLLAGMKDKNGKVLIPGFYDGVHIDDNTKALLAEVPDDPEVIRQKLGIARPDQVGANYQESIQYPSLNIMGMRSAWVGEGARTIVPADAVAHLDLRLTPETDGARLLALIKNYVLQQGYHLVSEYPNDQERARYERLASIKGRVATDAFRTDPESKFGQWVIRRMTQTFGKKPIIIRMTGGSVPIAHFINGLEIPAILIPVVNPDNNQHSPDENLRLGNLAEGIQTCIGLLLPDEV